MKKKFTKALSYTVVFSAALAAFIITGIDEEAVKSRLESEALQATGIELGIETVNITLPANLSIEGVDINHKNGTAVHFDKLKARFLWSSLFTLSPAVRVSANNGDGYIRADVGAGRFGKGLRSIEISGEKFPIGKTLLKAGEFQLPFDAEINIKNGRVEIAGGIEKSSGLLELSVENFTAKEGVGGASFLEMVKPESVFCAIEIKSGVLSTKNCGLAASAISVEVNVSSRLKPIIENSPLTGVLVVKPVDQMLKSLLMIYSKYKKKDGSYHFPLRGTFGRPRLPL